MPRRKRNIAAIVALSLLAVSVIGVISLFTKGMRDWEKAWGPSDSLAECRNEAERRAMVGQFVGKLPSSARDLHSWSDGGMDATYWIAFTLDSADIPEFMKEISLDPWDTQMPELPREVPADFKTWWHPLPGNVSVKMRPHYPDRAWMAGELYIIDHTTGTAYYCHWTS